MEKFSKHLVEERTDRYLFIATKIGFGTVVYREQKQLSNGRMGVVEISSTGVAFVRGLDNTIITMYVTTLAMAKKYMNIIPKDLYNTICRNQKKGYCLG